MTVLSPPKILKSSWVKEWQEGGVIFILEYFLANSLVPFSPGLMFSSCVYDQLNSCGWLSWFSSSPCHAIPGHPSGCSVLRQLVDESSLPSPTWNLVSVQGSLVYPLYLGDACLCIFLTHPLISCFTCSPCSFPGSLILAQQGSVAHACHLFIQLKACKPRESVPIGGQYPGFIS